MRPLARPIALLVAAALVALAPACSRYDQGSPEAVIAAAKEMVRTGHAERLPDLVYAESKDMRDLLSKLGEVLGTLQDLARDVQAAFPEEIEAYQRQAEEAAKRGEATSFLQRITGQALGGRRSRRLDTSPEEAEKMRAGFDTLMKDIFADPYGWLQQSEGRLTVSREGCPDDTAKVLWDGKPLLGFGVQLKNEGGRWSVVLPVPAGVMPRSPDSWEILGCGLEVVDKMLSDLRDDVRSRRVRRLEDLAHSAGEKAFLPAVLIALSYGKLKEAERKAPVPTAPSGTPAPAAGAAK
jgi:hypothetical protein